MTTSRQFSDSEGDFGEWKDHPAPCGRMILAPPHEDFTPRVEDADKPIPADLNVKRVCGAKVQYREWESSDGAYTDYQYRCEGGHKWWIDGIDS